MPPRKTCDLVTSQCSVSCKDTPNARKYPETKPSQLFRTVPMQMGVISYLLLVVRILVGGVHIRPMLMLAPLMLASLSPYVTEALDVDLAVIIQLNFRGSR